MFSTFVLSLTMTKSIDKIYALFPTKDSCFEFMENVRWEGVPTCPICKYTKFSPAKQRFKYHCNLCNRNFTVTVGTVFHTTKINLQIWFYLIGVFMNPDDHTSLRKLGEVSGITKDTVASIFRKIKYHYPSNTSFFQKIDKKINS